MPFLFQLFLNEAKVLTICIGELYKYFKKK